MKRITAAALIAAPVLFLVANVLHPKEYGRGHEQEQLQKIADSYTRWQVVHFLTFVAILLFVLAVIGLALVLYPKRPRAAWLGGVLGLWGLVALGGVVALDGFTWGVLGQVSTWPGVDTHSVANALHAVQQSNYNLPFYIGGLSWLIGIIVLAVSLARERLVPAWAGTTLTAGSVLVALEVAIENNVYFVIAAAVLALGGIGVGAAMRRIPDEQLAL